MTPRSPNATYTKYGDHDREIFIRLRKERMTTPTIEDMIKTEWALYNNGSFKELKTTIKFIQNLVNITKKEEMARIEKELHEYADAEIEFARPNKGKDKDENWERHYHGYREAVVRFKCWLINKDVIRRPITITNNKK